jgi:hypothetical protein
VGSASPCFKFAQGISLTPAARENVQDPSASSPGAMRNSRVTTPELSKAQPSVLPLPTVPNVEQTVEVLPGRIGAARTKPSPSFVDTRTQKIVKVQNDYTVPVTTWKSRRLVDARTGQAPTEETQELVTHNYWSYRRPVDASGVTVAYGTPGSIPHNEYMKKRFSAEETAAFNEEHGIPQGTQRPLTRWALSRRTRGIDLDTGLRVTAASKRIVPYHAWEGRLVDPDTGKLADRSRKPTVTHAEYVRLKNINRSKGDAASAP